MTATLADSNLPVTRPTWDRSRLQSRIVHLGCGAFHRAHQALYTHHLLETSDSDWGICEVNLMPGNDATLIQNLKAQDLLYTVAERGAQNTELKKHVRKISYNNSQDKSGQLFVLKETKKEVNG